MYEWATVSLFLHDINQAFWAGAFGAIVAILLVPDNRRQ